MIDVNEACKQIMLGSENKVNVSGIMSRVILSVVNFKSIFGSDNKRYDRDNFCNIGEGILQ